MNWRHTILAALLVLASALVAPAQEPPTGPTTAQGLRCRAAFGRSVAGIEQCVATCIERAGENAARVERCSAACERKLERALTRRPYAARCTATGDVLSETDDDSGVGPAWFVVGIRCFTRVVFEWDVGGLGRMAICASNCSRKPFRC